MSTAQRKRVDLSGLSGITRQTDQRIPSGTIWPSGDWSLGYRKVARDERLDERPVEFRSLRYTREQGGAAAGGLPPLDLRNLPNSHTAPKKKVKRGLKGITGYGRKMLRSAGVLLKEDCRVNRITFATITLPTMSRSDRRRVVDSWSELVRQLLQWLSRQLHSAGVPPKVLMATEIQSGRMQSTGEACLHIHLLWGNKGRKQGGWAVRVEDVKDWVRAALVRICGLQQIGYVNVDTRSPKGSVAAYLSKYMSKGPGEIAEAVEDWGPECCPSTWWNMTKESRDEVKSEMGKGIETGLLLECLVQSYFDNQISQWFVWMRHVELAYDDRAVNVGWRGAVFRDTCQELLSMVKSA